jgi:hypothetical protein
VGAARFWQDNLDPLPSISIINYIEFDGWKNFWKGMDAQRDVVPKTEFEHMHSLAKFVYLNFVENFRATLVHNSH